MNNPTLIITHIVKPHKAAHKTKLDKEHDYSNAWTKIKNKKPAYNTGSYLIAGFVLRNEMN